MNEVIEPLLKSLTTLLQEKKIIIATAESCTGGLIASLLTELPGSSAWFDRGFVTYSNEAKQELLGVEAGLLAQYGAVSLQTAEAMAAGALKHSHAHVALAVTGIAGPDGGTEAKPVGTVCFAFAERNGLMQSRSCLYSPSSRSQIRFLSCIEALHGMIFLLNQAYPEA
ncbi:nicotinamide-nucleotide amidohydrolase family protein [Legionella sp. MW5194]|uniref:CinA family protein n=1 Tax=Legionella sp. MW5194 TaxID=2662448 RepID=UPI00193DC225|nr:CinA family protein [Legionella sp. MW5194]QRN04342.1 nicotinamide-nucleotide amidohydrolase family protein [Legionella sp. MW5194]